MVSDSIEKYIDQAEKILAKIRNTQGENIERAAQICAESILGGGLVHLFGTGHSRMLVEEMFPRHGSFPGFHPIVELSLTYHNPVVGANGQRQAMFLEHVEGFGKIILRNFVMNPPDSMIIFSNSGVNELIIEIALEVKEKGLPLVAVTSREHCLNSKPKHTSGKRLPDIADITVDNCTPAGDALVRIDGLKDPVGPGSTIGGAVVTNAIKTRTAELLTEAGQPPTVLTSSYFIGEEESARQFDKAYDQYRAMMVRVYGCEEEGED